MTAGMPGTGLGGLLYVLLALFMPFRELYLTARGCSNRGRWSLVLRQSALAVAIVIVLTTTAFLANHLLTAGDDALSAPKSLLTSATVGVAVLAVLSFFFRAWDLVLATTSGRS